MTYGPNPYLDPRLAMYQRQRMPYQSMAPEMPVMNRNPQNPLSVSNASGVTSSTTGQAPQQPQQQQSPMGSLFGMGGLAYGADKMGLFDDLGDSISSGLRSSGLFAPNPAGLAEGLTLNPGTLEGPLSAFGGSGPAVNSMFGGFGGTGSLGALGTGTGMTPALDAAGFIGGAGGGMVEGPLAVGGLEAAGTAGGASALGSGGMSAALFNPATAIFALPLLAFGLSSLF